MNLNKHADYFNPNKHGEEIHIIGCGALGSNLAHLLVRFGFENITLYDFDTIAPHNLTNQFYKVDQIGYPKTESLKFNLHSINHRASINIEPKYEEQHLSGYVFLALDSIEERKRIMEVNQYNYNIKLISDLRLGLEEGQVFTATNDEQRENLLSNMQFKNGESKAPQNACGSTLTLMTTINIITALAVNNLISYLKENESHFMILTDSVKGIIQKY